MSAWLRHHAQSLRQTLARLAGAPFAALANVLVIGVSLALPLGAYGLLVNLQGFSGSLPTEPQISLFLSRGGARPDVAALEVQLKRAEGVRAVRFVSRDAALAGLKRAPGMAEVISSLRDNPLPDAFVVTLADSDASSAERLEKQFRALPGVAHVQVDSAWVRRIDALLRLGRTAVILLGTLLGFALVAVTFNTIRLQVLTQREEIEVSKLIGATDAFIRRPFFYLGSLLGAGGALAALAIIYLAFALLNRDLAQFGTLYGIEVHLHFISAGDAASVVFFASVLGWMGTYLSVSKHLYQIEPR
jgi:cell division transport system permease protein